MKKPIIHRHDGNYVCYIDNHRMYDFFQHGEGKTPMIAYQDWKEKYEKARESHNASLRNITHTR